MSGRESAEVRAAMADVDKGASMREAAKLHGIALSTLVRARKRHGKPMRGPGRPTTKESR